MFAGITWGQFALYVGLAVVIYYVAVMLVYFRAELTGLLGRSKKSPPNPARPPATTAAAPPLSPMGASTDYGHLFAAPPADLATPADPPVASPLPFLPSAETPRLKEAENAVADTDESNDAVVVAGEPDDADAAVVAGELDDWDAGLFADGDTAIVEQAGEDQAGIAAEIDLISFEQGQIEEVAQGGIPVEDLTRTIALMNQEETTPAEKQEISRQIGLFEGTDLLNTLKKHKATISQMMEEVEVETARAGRVGGRPARAAKSRRAAGKKAIPEEDVDKLLKTMK